MDRLGLVDDLFTVFLLLSVPLKKLFLVHSQVLHELFVFDLLASFMVSLDLVFHFFHTVSLVSVFLQLFPSEVAAIQELLFEETHRLIIIFEAL